MLAHPVTGDVMIPDADGSALYELIQQVSWGHDTAANRLEQVLDATLSVPPFMRPHFRGLGSRKGDEGFQAQFRDDHLYRDVWGFETPYSQQVGHFLTAVDMGRGGASLEDVWIRFIVGHEMYTDGGKGPSGLGPGGSSLAYTVPMQILQPTEYEIALFKQAVQLDAAGRFDERDDLLYAILDPSKHGGLEYRIGNSMEDLRLSVKGYRLGQMVSSGELATNKDVANWIAFNVAE